MQYPSTPGEDYQGSSGSFIQIFEIVLSDLDLDTTVDRSVTVVEWGRGLAESLAGWPDDLDASWLDLELVRIRAAPFGLIGVAFVSPTASLAVIPEGTAVAVDPIRKVRAGARGPELIPVLGATGITEDAIQLIPDADRSSAVELMQAKGLVARTLHGGMEQRQRDRVMQSFRSGKTNLLVATDVAARGLDVERIGFVVNYDIPWNPARLEQRMGRIHRYKQEKEAMIWNIVAENTREEILSATRQDEADPEHGAVPDEGVRPSVDADVRGDGHRGGSLARRAAHGTFHLPRAQRARARCAR